MRMSQRERKTLAKLPSVWDRERELQGLLAGRPTAVFLDYDGTLSPIVEDHTQATLSAEMRAAIITLARQCPVTIISGRDLARLRALVALDAVFLAGSHGFEIVGPAGSGETLERGAEFLAELDAAEGELREALAPIAGHSVERKKYAIAIHYRSVAGHDVDALRAIVASVLRARPRLRPGAGKKVLEVRPGIDWDKGHAALWILARLGARDTLNAAAVPLYIGDDLTDEDAFLALAGRGVCIAVRHDETRATAADYALEDTADVQKFLEWLAALLAASAP